MRLIENFRLNDIVGRIGGEEFAVLLPESDLHSAHEAAVRLSNSVRKPIHTRKTDLMITISQGITVLHHESMPTLARIFEEADKALYQAKREGRDRIVVYQQCEEETTLRKS